MVRIPLKNRQPEQEPVIGDAPAAATAEPESDGIKDMLLTPIELRRLIEKIGPTGVFATELRLSLVKEGRQEYMPIRSAVPYEYAVGLADEYEGFARESPGTCVPASMEGNTLLIGNAVVQEEQAAFDKDKESAKRDFTGVPPAEKAVVSGGA